MGKLGNRAGMTVTGTPGTGTITLNAAISSPKEYQTFADAGVLDGDLVSYLIEDGTEWEYGLGIYTASGTTLARTTVIASSNAGSAISATSAALVYIDAGTRNLWSTVRKPGDTTRNNTTTTSADPDLQFKVAANTVYDVRMIVKYRTTAAGDFKFGISGPAAPTEVSGGYNGRQSGGFEAYPTAEAVTQAADNAAMLHVEFTLENGANAGTVTFDWAQNTSNAGPTTVKEGSYIQYRAKT